MKEITVDIRRAAMDLLARREHSRQELGQKLLRRFSGQQDAIDIEIDRLNEEGLQSDSRLAEAFIRSRVNRGQGPVKIRAELRQKGVSDGDISLAMEACEVDWFEQARDAADRKFGATLAIDEDYDEAMRLKAKVSRFLQQRGFTFDHISRLF